MVIIATMLTSIILKNAVSQHLLLFGYKGLQILLLVEGEVLYEGSELRDAFYLYLLRV